MTTSVPPDDNSNRGPINVERVSVDRMSVDKSEIKTAEVDILIAISQATMDQTDTIQRSNEEIAGYLKKLAEGRSANNIEGTDDLTEVIKTLKTGFAELIPAINKSASATEDGAESAGLAGAEMRRNEKSFKAVNKSADTLRKAFLKMEDVHEVTLENYLEPSRKLGAETLKLISTMTRLNTVIDLTTKQFHNSIDLAGAGLVDFSDVFLNQFEKLWSPIDKAGDDIIETGRLIRSSIDSDLISPMLLVGGNINAVSKSFNKFRNDLDDTDLRIDAYADFKQQNEMIAEFLTTRRRRGISEDLNTEAMQTAFVDQQNALKLIAANTGKTVKELTKQQAIAAKSVDELVNLGIITSKQGDNLKNVGTELEASGNLRGAELVRLVTEARGNESFFAMQNKELFKGLQLSGTTHLIPELEAASKRGDAKETKRILTQMRDGIHQFTSGGEAQLQQMKLVAGGSETFLREFATQTSGMGTFQAQHKNELVREYFNKFVDFATNTFPLTAAASVVAMLWNTGKLLLNTVATIGLTTAIYSLIARGGIGGGGGAGGRGRGGRGAMGKIGSKLMGVGGGALAGLAAGGFKMADVAGDESLTMGQKSVQVGSTAAGGGLGFLGGAALGAALGGPFAPITGLIGGVLGSMAGSAGGEFVGENISGLMDGVTPPGAAPAAAPTPAIASPAVTANLGSAMNIGEKTMMMNQRQLMILTSINSQLVESNGIQRGIRDRIGLSGNQGVGPSGRDASSNSGGGTLVVGPLGAK